MKNKGTCLCGAVKITAELKNNKMGACHCSMCRKWSAGPYLVVDCGHSIDIQGEENVGVYQSSDWAQRNFCKQCGTNLFYKLIKPVQQFLVSSQLFDDLSDLEFDHQIFIDEKPAYYNFENQTKNMTGAEVFAQYS